jgi:hypothetical protein
MNNDLVDKKDLINKFLGTFKNHAQKRLISIPDREKNLKTLEEMGLTTYDVRIELMKLTYEDYIAGPKQDHDPEYGGEIWEFGKTVEKEEIYIKIKMTSNGKPVCLSFHYPEKQISYPFKKIK